MLTRKQTKIFQKWFESLSENIQDKIIEYIDRVLEGNISNCKALRQGVSELKIDYQKGYRIYYTILQNNIVLLLLSGGTKKEQQKDIDEAIEIKNYLKQQGVI